MAKPELGMKRNCLSCGAKFYDLNRDPILCPKCGTQFQAQMMRRAEAVKPDEDDEVAIDPVAVDLVPLEEAEADAPEKDIPGDDIDLGEDIVGADDDDTFLETEEEEDGGDVSDLIGSDIEEDDES